MSKYILSHQASKRLKQISKYTFENFGENQRKKYLTMLRNAMREAAKNPEQRLHIISGAAGKQEAGDGENSGITDKEL